MRADIDGAEIAYLDEGHGPALLLLHAFPLELRMWDDQAAALRSRFRVVRFDVRGFGGSSAGPTPLSMERIADDASALLDRLEIERVALVGCSMGGYAAFAFARRHPDRLSALALLDTRAEADSEEARRNRATLAARVLAEGPAALLTALLPRLLGESSRRGSPELVARVSEWIRAVAPAAAAAALFALAARADASATLAAIRVPVLVAAGEEDVITPPAEAEALAAAFADGRYAPIPRAGHLANLENPEAINAVLSGFLAGLSP
jgi:3-oxoadipate enol-lactonase